MSEPTQPSLRRLARFDVRPRRDLGQNFLIDSNILGVIERAAALGSEDVVLEVGGGLGVLSDHLAARARHVHVVEVDRRLEAPLRDALAPHRNVTLHLTDAMALELAALEPPPGKVIANLPYNIAASLLLRTIEQLAGVTLWVAMVQREVAARFAASPATRSYGIPSVLCQLACSVGTPRPVARSVFFPVPNVDSALITLTRHSPAAPEPLRRFVGGAFAHRRKSLARSLALSCELEPGAVRAALVAIDHPPDERAERLTPQELRALWASLS